ncbi:hypothetical protein [Desulforamulus putei]|uniref:Uncharacterized protein n=1 Tax=Desulforamulus putei DSM 12395 TaxID=1121429 RepID=A0A1M4TD40_9FIRM|nr:hypothetical protein [Desulforamulus putei]SHE42391.1 hypothetical protein SAMN02745133_00428 [Desulforamulus putei DSM 12395]
MMRDSTWRYPNFGFWAVHIASLAAMGYLAYKAIDCRCDADYSENRAFPERMPQHREPQADQF